jgi:glutathione reductase (NADPH)
VPSIVFTTPALGTVGLTEQKASDRKMHFRVTKGDTTDWYSSRRVAATKSAFKVLIDDDSERILGASILGPGAEELTNLFAMAIRFEIPGPSLRETLFAYPTAASDLASMV